MAVAAMRIRVFPSSLCCPESLIRHQLYDLTPRFVVPPWNVWRLPQTCKTTGALFMRIQITAASCQLQPNSVMRHQWRLNYASGSVISTGWHSPLPSKNCAWARLFCDYSYFVRNGTCTPVQPAGVQQELREKSLPDIRADRNLGYCHDLVEIGENPSKTT